MVLSETRRVVAGLTLFRVLRESLWLGECLGVTVAGRTPRLRLPPAPVVPDPGAEGEEHVPHRRLVGPGATVLAPSTASDRSVLLSSRGGA